MLIGLAPSVIRNSFPLLEYIGASADLGSGTSKTAAGQGIGVASVDRIVLVFVWYAMTGNTDLSSITIGGNSATIIGQNDGNNDGLAQAYLLVPSGTTADIVLTFAASVARCGVLVSTLKRWKTGTPHASHYPAGGAVGSRTATLNIPVEGVAWTTPLNSDAATDGTFTNATELVDQAYSSERAWVGKTETYNALSAHGISHSQCRCIGASSWS